MHAEIARTSPKLLQKISLSLTEYNLAKESEDELEWNDKMYDITSIKFSEGRIEVLALVDEAETDLLALLSRITQAASHDAKAPPAALMQYLSLTFTVPSLQENLLDRFALAIDHNTPYQIICKDIYWAITAPPPRVIR